MGQATGGPTGAQSCSSFREALAGLGSWGYVGVFVAELFNSAVILIPTPSTAYTFTMGATLNPLSMGLIGGTAAGLGELIGYGLGRRGASAVAGGYIYERIRARTARWTGTALFTVALLPLPFDVAGIWAGTMRYSPRRFLALVVMGKTVKVTVVAISGYYSINWLFGPLG